MKDIRCHILTKLFNKKIIGSKHTAIENSVKGLETIDQYEAKRVVKGLVKEGILLLKKTHYGDQVSLNPKKLREARSMMRKDMP